MSQSRRLLGYLIALLLIALAINESWGLYPGATPKPLAASSSKPNQRSLSYEEKAFLLQTKVMFGSRAFAETQESSAFGGGLQPDMMTKDAIETYASTLGPISGSGENLRLTAKRSVRQLHMELIVADALELDAVRARICRYLSSRDSIESQSSEASQSALRVCEETGGDSMEAVEITPELREELAASYGWLGSVLAHRLEAGAPGTLPSDVSEKAVSTFKSFLGALVIGVPLFLASLVCFAVLTYRFLKKRSDASPREQQAGSEYLLEAFALYLAVMFALPHFIRASGLGGSAKTVLVLNCFGISLSVLTMLWPLTAGVSFHELRRQLGLLFMPFGRLTKDLFIGPFAYFSSLSAFLLVLIAYALVLSAANVDPSSGAHPVVPLITSSGSRETIWLIVLIAVVLAPIVEEVVFRGALYTWMRSRIGPIASIAASSLLFAALHPQGAVGLVPLGFIGMILAALREHRGNLTASIFAHACFNAGTLFAVVSLFSD